MRLVSLKGAPPPNDECGCNGAPKLDIWIGTLALGRLPKVLVGYEEELGFAMCPKLDDVAANGLELVAEIAKGYPNRPPEGGAREPKSAPLDAG